MSRYNEIQAAKGQIKKMMAGLDYIKTEERKAAAIERINTFIALTNKAESLVNNDINMELFKVMYYRLFQEIYNKVKPGDGFFTSRIALRFQILQEIEMALNVGSSNLLNALAQDIATDAILASEEIPEDKKELSILDPDNKDLAALLDGVKNDYKDHLEGFLNTTYKTFIQWN